MYAEPVGLSRPRRRKAGLASHHRVDGQGYVNENLPIQVVVILK
jgi:hypothetical protein